MRKLKRSIARARMRRAGFTKLNKKSEITGKSPFQMYWKDYV